MSTYHVPVLLEEVLKYLGLSAGKVFLDATLGGGGHSQAILERLAGSGLLLGLDQDPEAIAEAQRRLGAYHNFRTVLGNFSDMKLLLAEQGITGVDGILLDLGVSSHQLDEPGRGFSFRSEARLDMRMNPESQGLTAADLLATKSEAELANIIRQYGEEKFAHKIAGAIVRQRQEEAILTTCRLAEIVSSAVPAVFSKRRKGCGGRVKPIHPATRTFQALRIAVNDELGALEKGLEAAVSLLRSGGILAVISYHSLEDRLVKNTFRKYAGLCTCPPRVPLCCCHPVKTLKTLTSRPLTPSEAEAERNPRARSAKMRVAQKF